MLHAMIHWPEETSLDLWPFAVSYAVYLWNIISRQDTGLSPSEQFYGVKSNHLDLKNAKVWGCPTYVLDPRLQDGHKIPKWEPRSRLGQFVGRSMVHSSTVGLIKNTNTGRISSQFHTIYDNHFTTLKVASTPATSSLPQEWIDLFTFQRESHFDPQDVRNEPDRQPVTNQNLLPQPSIKIPTPYTSTGSSLPCKI